MAKDLELKSESGKKNILLLCGGGGPEHDISLLSVQYFEKCLGQNKMINLIKVVVDHDGRWLNSEKTEVWLNQNRFLHSSGPHHFNTSQSNDLKNTKIPIDFAIPCIHGYPGESGDLQSYFEMIKLPYLGSSSETSKICFNKITTKLWATALGVENTPHIFISDLSKESQKKVIDFQKEVGELVIKASNQGSSVGCYVVSHDQDPTEFLNQAFQYSPFVLIEKKLRPRELEVAVYEYNGQVEISYPGEIIPPSSSFYSFNEKYSKTSQTQTFVRAHELKAEQVKTIQDYALKLFQGLKISHLARIDFFLDHERIYLNEINTFPGMTSISMFPQMMSAHGHEFKNFLAHIIHGLG